MHAIELPMGAVAARFERPAHRHSLRVAAAGPVAITIARPTLARSPVPAAHRDVDPT